MIPAFAAEAHDQALGVQHDPVLGVIAAGVSALTILPAHEDDLLWVAWTGETGKGRVIRLALVRRNGANISPLWPTHQDGGYAITLQVVPAWIFEGHPVWLLQYQLGAAYVHADFWGLTVKGRPQPLGEVEGAIIETAWSKDGEILRVYDDAALKDSPHCFLWDMVANKPTQRVCP